MKLIHFILDTRHDNGRTRIHTHASSEEEARKAVMAAERCPARSIVRVLAVNEAGFEVARSGPRAGKLVRLMIGRQSPSYRTTPAPNSRCTSGYGSKLPTPYMVRTIDSKWRRVYARCYSNAATYYVMHEGVKTVVEFV